MSWNIGKLEVYIEVSESGELRFGLDFPEDKLSEMFPINTLNRLSMTPSEYDDYVDKILTEKEAWIRENIHAGTYNFIIDLDSENMVLKRT